MGRRSGDDPYVSGGHRRYNISHHGSGWDEWPIQCFWRSQLSILLVDGDNLTCGLVKRAIYTVSYLIWLTTKGTSEYSENSEHPEPVRTKEKLVARVTKAK